MLPTNGCGRFQANFSNWWIILGAQGHQGIRAKMCSPHYFLNSVCK